MNKPNKIDSIVNDFINKHGNLYKITVLNNSKSIRDIGILVNCSLHNTENKTTAYYLNKYVHCKYCVSILARLKKVEESDTRLQTCIDKFGDIFTYHNFVYTGTDCFISFDCKVHGTQKVRYRSHLASTGCPKCSKIDNPNSINKSRLNFLTYIENNSNSQYDYSKVVYKGTKIKVEIICKEHGSFFQRPQNHMRGEGCPKCSVVKANKTKLEMGYGNNFSRSSYGKFKGDSNVYVFKLYNKNELFYKIGITKNIGSRIKLLNKDGYNVDCLYNYKSTCLDCWDIEKMLHFNFKNIRYTPKLKFKGSTECFNFVDIKDVDFLIQCCR